MTRDHLYQVIVQKLSGELDGDLFERCAVDLLRDVYPGLVPMSGGDDAGYDGAVGTSDGPYPLLSTVDRRGPLANLRKNLRKYRDVWPDGPRLALVATPRALSNRKRRNLQSVAACEFGVRLVNIHEQSDFANRLYRDSRWRSELLGVSGRPPALSALPPRSRPERPSLIGREDVLAWLRQTPGDLLIVGQPGVGKTYLHEALVSEGRALFAVDRDPERLADALRADEPEIVVVDDAHNDLETLRILVRLRAESGFSFAIHANCWRHAADEVSAALEMPAANVRLVDVLVRSQVLEVIKDLGVGGPDAVLHLLLDQSEGKPGLAAALVAAARRGDLQRVWSGEALADCLLHSRQLLRGTNELPVLAACALTGDAGASMHDLEGWLSVPTVEVRRTVINLGAGGMIEEVPGTDPPRLSIRPPTLRPVLVRDCFYSGPGRLDVARIIAPLRRDSRRIGELTGVLLATRQRDVAVPDGLLLSLAAEANSDEVWRLFGFADTTLSELLIREMPDVVLRAADGLLHTAPESALRALLPLAPSDNAGGAVATAVRRWLEGDQPGDPVSIERRRQLLGAVRETLGRGGLGDADAYAWVLAMLLVPDIDLHRSPPGDRRAVTIYSGLRPLDQLEEISALWPDVLDLARNLNRLGPKVRSVIEAWCFPGRHAQRGVAENVRTSMAQTAAMMLRDIQTLPACGRVCRSWISRTTSLAGLSVSVATDPLFRRVFHSRDFSGDFHTHDRRRDRLLTAVARKLSPQGPSAALRDLATLEREAADFGWDDGYDRGTLYYRLAELATQPVDWLNAAVEERLPAPHVHHFVAAVVRASPRELQDALTEMMAPPQAELYGQLARLQTLSIPNVDPKLLDTAVETLEVHGHATTFDLVRAAPTDQAMERLLGSGTEAIRVHAALAEWLREPKGEIRRSVREVWRTAILVARNEHDHVLGQILSTDPELAFDWVHRKFEEARTVEAHRFDLWQLKRLFGSISSVLDVLHRRALLELVEPGSLVDDVIETLMFGDGELFRHWLRFRLSNGGEGARYFALRPLDRPVDEVWESYATVAADEGISSDELAKHIYGSPSGMISGPFSEHYLGLAERFERLAEHDDHRLRLAGRRGVEWARSSAERELIAERAEAVLGR